jgi:hypothetical protein
MAHQVECSFIDEIGTMNRRAIGPAWEKARAIDVPDIVCWRGGICQRRSVFCLGYDSRFSFFAKLTLQEAYSTMEFPMYSFTQFRRLTLPAPQNLR